MCKLTSMAPLSWGFDICGSLSIVTHKDISKEKSSIQQDRSDKLTDGMARKIINQLNSKKLIKPSFSRMIAFNAQKKVYKNSNKEKADYKYWKQNGWLEKDCKFYIDARINPLKNLLAKIISNVMS
ncbi:hypothetical protein [Intestinibacter sp.]